MTDRDDGDGGGASDTEVERALSELERAADELHIPPVGARVDRRYRVVEHVGQGGFGWVFGVQHEHLDQRFAMKILNPRIARDPLWIKRFREEARATSLIGHENIVFVTDFGECQEWGYYLVMEYLDGVGLDELLAEQGAVSPEQTMRFAIAAGSALSAVHELGIVHCDLKPSNAMMIEGADGREIWKLLDFGTSTIVMAAAESDAMYGTPAYMAPEQAIGAEVDHRADQFSLGCIIYRMLTGAMPWITTKWMEAAASHRGSNPPPPPSKVCDGCPEAIDPIVMRALELRPQNRWPDVEAFVEALESAIKVEWIPAADPLDVRTDGTDGFQRSLTAPDVNLKEADDGAGQSLVIRLEEGDDDDLPEFKPTFEVVFRTGSRLRREYRRNLIAGGLFVPCGEVPELRSDIDIKLVYGPTNRSIKLTGTVVSHDSPEPRYPVGFGVAFGESTRRALRRFLRSLQLGLGMSQNDLLRRSKSIAADAELSAGEAFVISRIRAEMPVGRVRAMCSGLPFEFEETIASLLEEGYLELEQGSGSSVVFHSDAEQSRTGTPAIGEAPESPATPTVEFSAEERDKVLELVDFFRARHNYMAAMDVLRKAVELSPEVAEFHHRIAVIHSEFTTDRKRALDAAERALALDPGNETYEKTVASLEDDAS